MEEIKKNNLDNSSKKENNVQYDKSFKELINKAENSKEFTASEIEILKKCYGERLNPIEILDEVEIPSENYVIFTDGKEQVVYEKGEYYIVSTVDGKSDKKKIKKMQAKEMYLEYFMRYTLNKIQLKNKTVPIINKIEVKKHLEKKTKERKKLKEEIKENIKYNSEIMDNKSEEIKKSLSKTTAKTVTEEIEIEKIKNKIKANSKERNNEFIK